MPALPTRPPLSVAVTVMWCVPSLSMFVAKLAPLARTPSRSDVHRIVEERSPSVASRAVAVKDVLASCVTVPPPAGEVMVSAGGVGVMMTVICAVEVAPSESVTEAVIVCWPSRSRTAFDAPTKSAPWRLDVHWTWLEMSPSKSSLAVAVRITSVSAGADELSCGAVMARAGATFGPRIRTMAWAWPTFPLTSVTAAVIVCVPRLSERLMLPPVPSDPSRSELHWSRLLRLPSSKSLAVPMKATGPWAT